MTRTPEEPTAHVVESENLPHSATAHRFEGRLHGGANVSFFLIDSDRGGGPDLHTHPYAEVFVIQEGEVTFTAGDETIEAKAGQIVVVARWRAPQVRQLRGRTGQTRRHPRQRAYDHRVA